MSIETRAVEPFYKNGYVVGCEESREGIIIDPGDEVGQLADAVRQHALSIRYILLTHAHLDHITGVAAAKRAFGAPVGLHQADEFLYDAVVQQGQMFGLRVEPQPKVDGEQARTLFVGDTLFAGSIGRTDLPGGDHETLLRSIRTVLFRFPDDSVVHSGHGEMTTIGRERRTNPFLIE